MEDKGVGYPGGDFNYSDGRFTNSSDTDPTSQLYAGVWHEQLARAFLNMSASPPSLDGGDDFAFGGATTEDGDRDYTLINGGIFGDVTVTIDNMGKQVNDYITRRTVDPAALYVVWGGGNDLFDDDRPEMVTATSARMAMLVSRLANAGARYFLVPNIPPLGDTPRYNGGDPVKQTNKNRASLDYRAQLDADLNGMIDTLAAQGITIQVNRVDIWSLFLRFVSDPARYGFTDMSRSAQDRDVNPDTFLFWDDIHPTTAAHYQIANEANRVLTGAVVAPARAVNLATRVTVAGGENVSIGGFIVSGTDPKRVVLRGIGPSLSSQGVTNPLPNPRIELFDEGGSSIYANDNWEETQAAEIAATGLAPTNPQESAIVRTLDPGSYTVQLSGVDSASGVGLVEVYDINSAANSNLANISTRGAVGTGDDVMIGGVIIDNGGEVITIVRAMGPSLTTSGVTAPLTDPTLELYDSNGERIAANDDWNQGQALAAKATLLAPGDDRESLIAASLAPGNYTAVVRGKDNATGVALVEVYRIP
jgi:phospholipase/lecithinase/hemolysin